MKSAKAKTIPLRVLYDHPWRGRFIAFLFFAVPGSLLLTWYGTHMTKNADTQWQMWNSEEDCSTADLYRATFEATAAELSRVRVALPCENHAHGG